MPAPLWFDPTGEELGSPGIVIEMFDGEALVSLGRRCDPSELPGFAPRLAEVGGALAAFPLGGGAGVPRGAGVVGRLHRLADPVLGRRRAEARRSRSVHATDRRATSQSNRPPPVPLGLVHGDFQVANVLLGDDRNDVIVDWELAHIGDPREDLGWCMMASVTQPPDIVGADEEAFYDALPRDQRAQRGAGQPGHDRLLPAAGLVDGVRQRARAARRAGRAARPTGIQVAYMSPAVSGMHDVFYRALKRHAAASGGAK